MNRPDAPALPRARLLAELRGALRISRFEIRIAAALVVAATLPLVGALLLADRVAAENLALGLDPRVVQRLQAVPALYGDLFQARKQLYAAQTRELARGLPARHSAEAARAYLAGALARTPRLRRIELLARLEEVAVQRRHGLQPLHHPGVEPEGQVLGGHPVGQHQRPHQGQGGRQDQ
ncbi:MAG TPA: hypothetical protein VFG53_14730, partial [Anaeromyxobacter sp.]|nr:hypothetical protein [Anaeromyxobacter sp.]